MKFAFIPLLAALTALTLTGCAGYQLGAIKPTPMRHVRTVAIPSFKNDTLEPRAEVITADQLIKQIQLDGTYRVVNSDKADAILEGTIKKIYRKPQRSVLGDVLATQEFTLIIQLQVNVVDRATGKILMRRNAIGTSDFFVSNDIQQDERQALPLATAKAVKQLTSQLTEGW